MSLGNRHELRFVHIPATPLLGIFAFGLAPIAWLFALGCANAAVFERKRVR
jgi:hypothetical protein